MIGAANTRSKFSDRIWCMEDDAPLRRSIKRRRPDGRTDGQADGRTDYRHIGGMRDGRTNGQTGGQNSSIRVKQ